MLSDFIYGLYWGTLVGIGAIGMSLLRKPSRVRRMPIQFDAVFSLAFSVLAYYLVRYMTTADLYMVWAAGFFFPLLAAYRLINVIADYRQRHQEGAKSKRQADRRDKRISAM